MRNCVKISREVIAQPAMDAFRGKELVPGSAVRTDAEIDAWVRDNAYIDFHPVGTCKMGIDGDPAAVCDDRLRVRGIDGLRVADASIIPLSVGGNTNAPSMMIGEKVADLIRNAGARSAAAA
jgi:choline dehydrogenase